MINKTEFIYVGKDNRICIPKAFIESLDKSYGDCVFVKKFENSDIHIHEALLEDSTGHKVDQYHNIEVRPITKMDIGSIFKIEYDGLNRTIILTYTGKKKEQQTGIKPYLKWAGGKYRLIPTLITHMPCSGIRLIEPFVGAASIFLNTEFDSYLLSDINEDLINTHNLIKHTGADFISKAKSYFIEENNTEDTFYDLRKRFNATTDTVERSCLFVYLNRHCYNGLCRYNSTGGFNVPFGRYSTIYFPEKEMLSFHEKSKNAEFIVSPFQNIMENVRLGDIVYCDPPYVPLTTNFTYTGKEFGLDLQQQIADRAKLAQSTGASVFVSNHDCEITRELYKEASDIIEFTVQRNISGNADCRGHAKELLAIYCNENYNRLESMG